ncbi:hypothetical protein B5M42_007955 [Paenibacillus athensensis]|uniref:Uncharacterized protein n=1 Tax=Paenibacillus athensensis TaxID=1967502 RepID=A0A4Y8PVG6_9BACL|nr:hypothetical protein [Paenibacillus athensensis]MCD1258768.1 hypothetical protein [Paenibacillus athensensis]
MFFNSSKRLQKRYGELRIYTTEIQFMPDGSPGTIYLFLTEHNTEIEVHIEKIQKWTRKRSQNESMAVVQSTDGLPLLLVLDNNRGNHYVYCTHDVYNQLVSAHLSRAATGVRETAPTLEKTYGEAAPSAAVSSHSPTHHKILFIDSYILTRRPELLEAWVMNNEIVISPYYDMEIGPYVSGLMEQNRIISIVENLAARYPGRLSISMYADTNSRNLGVDLSNEQDYLLLLATQQNVTLSQITIVTASVELSRKAAIQGLAVYNPLEDIQRSALTATDLVRDQLEREQAQLAPSRPPDGADTLPPRSSRHSKKKGQSQQRSVTASFFNWFF